MGLNGLIIGFIPFVFLVLQQVPRRLPDFYCSKPWVLVNNYPGYEKTKNWTLFLLVSIFYGDYR
jgi:hypothetical protein